MVLWRISNYADLRGMGGLRAPGRWHYAGLLEILVDMEIAGVGQLPDRYQLLRVEVRDDVPVAEIAGADVPDDWRQNLDWSRGVGTEWLQTETSAVLKVPSAVVPFAHNFLFNPAHPAADAVQIVDALHVKHDDRILKLLTRG
jgi:hypothetical protein